jgi:hypothetical protein
MAMALKQIDLAYQTMFSELEERCLDAEFDQTYPETGRFKIKNEDGKRYWYFSEKIDGKERKRYAGRFSDPDITKRVKAFRSIKDDFSARRRLASMLVNNARLPRPDETIGNLVEALWKAGVFRVRAVLIGSVAYGCYPGLLGVRLPAASMRTGDVDMAQFHSISVSVDDSIPNILEVLRAVDSTFEEIPHQIDGRFATKYVAADGLKVEFLTPNYSKDEYQGKPAQMPALGGASAQPLRFLDFLIHNPVRSVLLHKGGVPVLIPAPERYAVHKLIVSCRRRVGDNLDIGYDDDGTDLVSKRDKDVMQAGLLVEALAMKRRHMDLAEVWIEAWRRGPAWREGLIAGRAIMEPGQREILVETVRKGCRELGENPNDVGFADDTLDDEPSTSPSPR